MTALKSISFLSLLSVLTHSYGAYSFSSQSNTLRRRRKPFSRCFATKTGRGSDDQDNVRRDLLTNISGFALSSLLLGHPELSLADDGTKPLTFVITGANSGIGFEACRRLAPLGHNIVLACRSREKALNAIERVGNGNLIAAECDLASLASIKAFVDKLPGLIGDGKVDRLCLNAGVARNTASTDCARTVDGFELTVGTNHFGHFYLNHLVQSKSLLQKDARIIVTASGVHDPESPGGAQGVPATLGDMQGLRELGKSCEMIDGGNFNADKAYKDSKLCNVLFTRELQRRLTSSGSDVVANCFNPGLIVTTGLFRDQNPVFTKLFDVVATDLAKVAESPSWGGGALAYVTNVRTKGEYYSSPPGSVKFGDAAFGNRFTPTSVSKEAEDAVKAADLWTLSEKALGI